MALTPDQVPLSGDLAQLSQQLGISQEEIINLRRQRFTDTVTSAEGKPGDLETKSFAERSALGGTGTGTKATSYWDASRGVQVYAPYGSHFELLPGGGVKTISGLIPGATAYDKDPAGSGAPASSLFTQGTQGAPDGGTMATPNFKEEQLAITPAEGKTIERTGQTLKNPQTGVDVYAKEGNILIQYSDGTFEERPVSSINQPGQAKAIGEAGPTAEELGITRKTSIQGGAGPEVTRAPMSAAQALAAAQTPAAKEQIITGEGLTPTSDFELIGSTYQAAGGQTRTAREGYAFYQDKKTRRIVQRPLSQQQFAAPTTSPSVLAERQKTQQTIPPISADALLANYGLSGINTAGFTLEPIKSFEDTFTALLDRLGVGDSTAAKAAYQSKIEKLDREYRDEVANINDNPWLAEGTRVIKINKLKDKYDLAKSQLVAEVTLLNTFDERAFETAKYVATTALSQYNKEREFRQDEIENALRRASTDFDQQIKLSTLKLNEQELDERIRQFNQQYQLDVYKANKPSGGGSPYASIKSAQGGLIDLSTGKWVVPPQPQEPKVLNEQGLQTAYGQWAAQNADLGRGALESQAASGGLDPKSSFVQNTISAVSGSGGGVWGKVRDFLGF